MKVIPEIRSEQEIAGYRDALALIHESATHMAFQANVILQLHSMIYRFLQRFSIFSVFIRSLTATDEPHAY